MESNYLLSLDLGVASIGWSLLALDDAGHPSGIIRIGTHVFESGSPVNEFERGKDEPPAKPRRDARQLRKMIWRRARRKRKLIRLLQQVGLLPPGDVSTPFAIDSYMKALDGTLAETWNKDATHREHQLLPYRLRAAALDRDLSPVEFGRALYHLAQRRGFLSNRKSKEKADEKSTVKAGISELAREIAESGSRTLGEYFASIDPEQIKLRRRWTARRMFTDEFDAIWSRQSKQLALTEAHRQAIHEAIFHQRPLKSSDHLIGRCRHLPDQRRAPMACRLFQRFRILQKVNDLLLVRCEKVERPEVDKDGQLKINPKTGKPKTKAQWLPVGDGRPLTNEERAIVLDMLCDAESVKLSELRKRIDAPADHRFNFETQDESTLPGHKTDCRLAKACQAYANWPEEKKTTFVDELLGSLDDAPLRERIREAYKLDDSTIEAVFDAGLEDAYAGLSRVALRRLMPHLEAGKPYATARKEEFGESDEKRIAPVDRLPPVLKFSPDLRNPTVLRGLTEVRKLVNLIVKRYGKPQCIHIELLRQLKQSRELRAKASAENEARRKLRERAAERIVRETGVARANGRDIEKFLLAEECGWECPYTGKTIDIHNLFVEPEFEIEHIYPYSQSLDDSFANKTLCQRDANREKGNRLPAEAFSRERLDEILNRVSHFRGDLRDAKMRRFKATQIPEGFTNRQLTDSSYLARSASQYLGLLYGGVNDDSGTKRIHTRVGQLTAQLRRLWGLNQILSGTDEKTRDDHRHHAIDAVVVGCADTRTVAEMMRVASNQIALGRSRISQLPPPWPRFFEELVDAVNAVVVSHRQSRKISGKLHGETNYSRPKKLNNGDARTIRKPVTSLKESDFPNIVDPRIRNAVKAAFAASGKSKPEQAFAEGNFPRWMRADGSSVPIKRVSITTNSKPMTIGEMKDAPTPQARSARVRYVDSTQGSNHHARIIAKLAPDGTEKSWYDQIVTRFEMYQRKVDGKLGVDQSVGPKERFKFSLAANEFIEVDDLDPDGNVVGRMLCRVLSVSDGDFEFVHHLDGRTAKARKDQKSRMRGGASWLKTRNARKVFVNYLGEVKNAGG